MITRFVSSRIETIAASMNGDEVRQEWRGAWQVCCGVPSVVMRRTVLVDFSGRAGAHVLGSSAPALYSMTVLEVLRRFTQATPSMAPFILRVTEVNRVSLGYFVRSGFLERRDG